MPDPLEAFLHYLQQQKVDDPRVWATVLFDEVVDLGFDRSRCSSKHTGVGVAAGSLRAPSVPRYANRSLQQPETPRPLRRFQASLTEWTGVAGW